MKNSLLLISSLFCSALAFGCADDKDQNTTKTSVTSVGNPTSDSDSSATDATGGTDTNVTNGTTTNNSGASDPTDPDPTTSAGTDPGTSTGGCSFLGCTGSTGTVVPTCDVFAQDCPDGEKCSAIISDGGSSWDTAACVPAAGSGQPGDACIAESVAAGLDDCAKGAMCWDVDDMGMGTCVALCTGTADAPICPDQGFCTIANDGALNLCLPACSPLLQDCAEGNACYPVGDAFTCAPDASGDTGVANDPCEFINVCQAGLMCAGAAFVGAGCPQGSTGCCTPFCDLGEPADCPNPDQSCVEFYDPANLPVFPADAADIGVCGLPG